MVTYIDRIYIDRIYIDRFRQALLDSLEQDTVTFALISNANTEDELMSDNKDTDIDVALDDDPMPTFTIQAKDSLALDALRLYSGLCHQRGLSMQAAEVVKAHAEMSEWRSRHPELVKAPDHKHVPVKRS